MSFKTNLACEKISLKAIEVWLQFSKLCFVGCPAPTHNSILQWRNAPSPSLLKKAFTLRTPSMMTKAFTHLKKTYKKNTQTNGKYLQTAPGGQGLGKRLRQELGRGLDGAWTGALRQELGSGWEKG